jgi:hypothetical protein
MKALPPRPRALAGVRMSAADVTSTTPTGGAVRPDAVLELVPPGPTRCASAAAGHSLMSSGFADVRSKEVVTA